MNNTTTSIKDIENNETYKLVLRESFGGIMYNVANRDKYDTTELLNSWDSLDQREKNSANGIMIGAINFLQGN